MFGFRQGEDQLGLLSGFKLQEQVIYLTARKCIKSGLPGAAGKAWPLAGKRFGGRLLRKCRYEFSIVQRQYEAMFTGATITECLYLPG